MLLFVACKPGLDSESICFRKRSPCRSVIDNHRLPLSDRPYTMRLIAISPGENSPSSAASSTESGVRPLNTVFKCDKCRQDRKKVSSLRYHHLHVPKSSSESSVNDQTDCRNAYSVRSTTMNVARAASPIVHCVVMVEAEPSASTRAEADIHPRAIGRTALDMTF